MSRLEMPSPTLKEVAYEARRYLCKKFKYQSQRFQFLNNEMKEFPGEFRDFLKHFSSLKKDLNKNFHLFCKKIIGLSTIQITIGKRRHGKTAFLLKLAEEYHKKGFYVACYNMSKDLPKFCHNHDYNPKKPYFDVPRKAFIIHDEMHLDIDSKVWNSPAMKAWRGWVSTSGHREQTLNGTSQLASNISLDMVKYADVKIFKPMNNANDESDRKDYLRRFSFFYPKSKDEFLADVDGKLYYGRNDLPRFYTKKISEAFR